MKKKLKWFVVIMLAGLTAGILNQPPFGGEIIPPVKLEATMPLTTYVDNI